MEGRAGRVDALTISVELGKPWCGCSGVHGCSGGLPRGVVYQGVQAGAWGPPAAPWRRRRPSCREPNRGQEEVVAAQHERPSCVVHAVAVERHSATVTAVYGGRCTVMAHRSERGIASDVVRC